MADGKVLQISELACGRDLSGGVFIRLGDRTGVLSPQEAMKFAEGILKAAGCERYWVAGMPVIRQRLVS